MKEQTSKQTSVQAKTLSYAKAQLLEAGRYSPLEKDVLSALLADGELYSMDQVQKTIDEYMKRKVK